jgi:hypothetical protein
MTAVHQMPGDMAAALGLPPFFYNSLPSSSHGTGPSRGLSQVGRFASNNLRTLRSSEQT